MFPSQMFDRVLNMLECFELLKILWKLLKIIELSKILNSVKQMKKLEQRSFEVVTEKMPMLQSFDGKIKNF